MDIYVDIGNTHTVFGILKNDKVDDNLLELRFSTKSIETSEDIYSRIYPFLKEDVFEVENFVISSVVPQINFVFDRFIDKYVRNCKVYWVEASDKIPIDWQTEDYKQMGADRVADILGAIYLFNDNFIIVDFGTAITLDLVYNRKYIGGSISPGFALLIKSLFQETAKLPMVEIKPTMKIVDNTTIGQIQLGTVDVICRGINSLITEIKNNYKNIKVILTGGFSKMVKDIIINDNIIPKLQFIGMKYYVEILNKVSK